MVKSYKIEVMITCHRDGKVIKHWSHDNIYNVI